MNNMIEMNDGIIPMTPIQVRIFNELSSGRSITRKELVKTLKTPRTTIYDNLTKLQNQKLVQKYSVKRKANDRPIWGRPTIYWFIPKGVLNKVRSEIDLIDGLV